MSQLDDFLRGYLECAVWTGTDESDDSGGLPLDQNYGVEDFTKAAVAQAKRDCKAFLKDNEVLLATVSVVHGRNWSTDYSKHGHDFWLTRNRQGAGFWDRGYGKAGDLLTEACKPYGEQHVYVTRRGKLGLE